VSKLCKKLIGYVEVDSGQLMVVDPCYLSKWQDNEFNASRRCMHKDGTILVYGIDFKNYEQVIEKYGATMNQLIARGEARDMKFDADDSMSYNGACVTTINQTYGLLDNGSAAVFSSGYGDGSYPVYAHINDEGKVIKVTIDMK
jgi:hypothetical protein